ncbi:hypothetical protein D3C71_1399910 [compost metagenome]
MDAALVAGFQVIAVGLDALGQHVGGRCVLQRVAEVQAGTGADGAVVGGQVGGQGVEQRAGFFGSAGLEQGQCEVELEFVLVRLGVDGLAQRGDFGLRVQWQCFGFGDGRCGFQRQHAVLGEEFAQLAFGHGAGEAIDDLAVLDQEHRGHRADLEGGSDLLLLVHIDLGQLEGAVVLTGQLLQKRPQALARPAPGGPEVDQHGRLHGLLQNLGLEGVGGGFENVGKFAHDGVLADRSFLYGDDCLGSQPFWGWWFLGGGGRFGGEWCGCLGWVVSFP